MRLGASTPSRVRIPEPPPQPARSSFPGSSPDRRGSTAVAVQVFEDAGRSSALGVVTGSLCARHPERTDSSAPRARPGVQQSTCADRSVNTPCAHRGSVHRYRRFRQMTSSGRWPNGRSLIHDSHGQAPYRASSRLARERTGRRRGDPGGVTVLRASEGTSVTRYYMAGASSFRYASQPAASSTRGPKAHNREVLILLLGEHPGIFTTLAPV